MINNLIKFFSILLLHNVCIARPPRFLYANNSCWVETAVQCLYTMPLFVDWLLDHNKESLKDPLLQELFDLFFRIKNNDNNQLISLEKFHQSACTIFNKKIGEFGSFDDLYKKAIALNKSLFLLTKKQSTKTIKTQYITVARNEKNKSDDDDTRLQDTLKTIIKAGDYLIVDIQYENSFNHDISSIEVAQKKYELMSIGWCDDTFCRCFIQDQWNNDGWWYCDGHGKDHAKMDSFYHVMNELYNLIPQKNKYFVATYKKINEHHTTDSVIVDKSMHDLTLVLSNFAKGN